MTPAFIKIEFEYADGSVMQHDVGDMATAWHMVRTIEKVAEIKSAWRDGEPWFGLCTALPATATP